MLKRHSDSVEVRSFTLHHSHNVYSARRPFDERISGCALLRGWRGTAGLPYGQTSPTSTLWVRQPAELASSCERALCALCWRRRRGYCVGVVDEIIVKDTRGKFFHLRPQCSRRNTQQSQPFVYCDGLLHWQTYRDQLSVCVGVCVCAL